MIFSETMKGERKGRSSNTDSSGSSVLNLVKEGKYLDLEATKALAALPVALVLPADEVDVNTGASVKVVLDPLDVINAEADLEDLSGDVAHGLDHLVDDRLELLQSRNVGNELEKLLLSGADGVCGKLVLEDLVVVPGEGTDDGEDVRLDGDGATDAAVLADGGALLPGVLGLETRAEKLLVDWERRSVVFHRASLLNELLTVQDNFLASKSTRCNKGKHTNNSKLLHD